MKISYVQHNNIDFSKWDDCINCSLNGIVYAYSWYLNIVADEWDALIGDDYKAVFPLVKGGKYGVQYLYQPLFTQQLGVFSPVKIDSQDIKLFLDLIPKKIQYQVINFNTFNNLENISGEVFERITYQFDLIQPYFNLSSNYNDNTKRNISKSIAMGVNINKMLSVADYVHFKRQNLIVPLKSDQIERLNRIMVHALEKGVGEIYAAFTSQRELCAAAFFIRSNDKVIYLSAVSNELGRANRAMFALVDQFINDYSESHLVLDFEGSSIENVARFYAGFGAKKCKYQQLIVNRLPWYLKLFKR
ncbi:MAG: hypothetical protein HXX16_03860 [Bacteroidales bacterium]|nr:hypothetical protein [Bacteroidales bacterium]